MEKKFVDFICSLHGYCIRTKEIHWNTENNATHLLCDEIMDSIDECEDRFGSPGGPVFARKFHQTQYSPLPA